MGDRDDCREIPRYTLMRVGMHALGIGHGSHPAEEFEALGVPFAGRASRTVEYIKAIRRIWR
jgi:alkanesulfonate monooxygenase SsuD/methylene tetrahydromethanopterin reductase-like flavin-dependent oxidoreductase (luciferase family)